MIDQNTTIADALKMLRETDAGIITMAGRKKENGEALWLVVLAVDEDAVKLERIAKEAQFGDEPGR